ncbi:MAG: IspD/TarI family cytidylyltransferase, partial [Gaiellaceae bacterium]
VKRVGAGGIILETVARDDLVGAQTPQAFLAPALRRAFERELAGATDCASLVERSGGRVAVVEGDPKLIKVTTPSDLALVETLLRSA